MGRRSPKISYGLACLYGHDKRLSTFLASLDSCTSNVTSLELVDHLLHGDPFDALVLVYKIDEPLVHEHDLRFPN